MRKANSVLFSLPFAFLDLACWITPVPGCGMSHVIRGEPSHRGGSHSQTVWIVAARCCRPGVKSTLILPDSADMNKSQYNVFQRAILLLLSFAITTLVIYGHLPRKAAFTAVHCLKDFCCNL